MEENANLVVRLLIRRPECLGPALRGGTKTHSSRRQRLNSQTVGQSGSGGAAGTTQEGLDQLSPPGSPEITGDSGAGVNSAGSTTGGVADDAHSTTASQANVSSSAGGGLLKGKVYK